MVVEVVPEDVGEEPPNAAATDPGVDVKFAACTGVLITSWPIAEH